MIDDTRALHLLREHLDREPTLAPAGLLASIVAGLDHVPQRKLRFGVRGRLGGIQPVTGSRRLWLAMAVGVLALALGATALLPGFPWSAPRPMSTPTSSAAPTAIATNDVTPSGEFTPYTSGVNPWVTFTLGCSGTGCRPSFADELCGSHVTVGSIEFPHAKSCIDSVGVIRPASVDCGTVDAHPDASALAAAMLANAQLHATDLGSLQSGNIPADLFAETYDGRVIQILGGPTSTGSDSARCNLLLEPSLGLAPIEIRSDTATTIVLVEVASSLFVVRVQAASPIAGSPNMFLQGHLLNLIHDIRFIP